jgi:hypothetical protein
MDIPKGALSSKSDQGDNEANTKLLVSIADMMADATESYGAV